jgi:cytokinin dehydrogenase
VTQPARRSDERLAVALRTMVRGEVAAHDAAIRELSMDFGGIVRKRARVVVRPVDAEDVARVVRFASARGLSIAMRSAGHSLNGQSLSDGGVLLDMRGLNRIASIDTEQGTVDAEPGVVWLDLVAAAAQHQLVPPVLTNYLRTTVGGTHSVGGLGTSSFRFGTQADNCVGLEVVTGEGDTVWCSPTERPMLYQHVLCGFGHFGVITNVRHRVRRHAERVRSRLLVYTSRRRLFDDLRRVSTGHVADFVGAWGMRVGTRWLYAMAVTVEQPDDRGAAPDTELGAGLQFDRAMPSVESTFADFILSPGGDAGQTLDVSQTHAHPWVDAIMTPEAAEEYMAETLASLPADVLDGAWLLFWPLDRRAFRLPLFMLPDEDMLMLVSIMPTVPRSGMARAAALMARAARRGVELGGKRYLYGWGGTTPVDWRAHFGAYWPTLQRAKQLLDPDGVLNTGFLQIDPPGPSLTT